MWRLKFVCLAEWIRTKVRLKPTKLDSLRSHPGGRKRKKATNISVDSLLILCRRRPTLPHTFACSTIGPAGLNFRVRDGNGWVPRGMITDNSEQRAMSCEQ